MKSVLSLIAILLVGAVNPSPAADTEEGFTTIFDGKTFTGWKTSIDNTNTWKIEDGAFVTRGQTAHVFYIGDTNAFKNFELKVDVITEPNSMAASIFTRPTRKEVSRAPASNARSTSATQTGSKPAAFTASATSASLPAKTTNGGLSTSSFAAARSPSKSTAKPSSNTTNRPSLLKAAANASARAHSPYKPMTPKASSATKTSALNAWTCFEDAGL